MSLGTRMSAALRDYGSSVRDAADWLPPPAHEILLPDMDDEEPSPPSPVATPPMLVFLSYRDSRGRDSTRHVTIYKVAPRADHYVLTCRCHQRNAWRTFRSDRIRELVTSADGEVFEDADEFVREFLIIGEDHDPAAAALDAAFGRCADLVIALSYLARCDGDYDAREREVIWSVMGKVCADLDYDPTAAARRIALLRPDFDDFIEAVERLAEGGNERALALAQGAVDVVSADQKHHPEELRLLKEIDAALVAAGYVVSR